MAASTKIQREIAKVLKGSATPGAIMRVIRRHIHEEGAFEELFPADTFKGAIEVLVDTPQPDAKQRAANKAASSKLKSREKLAARVQEFLLERGAGDMSLSEKADLLNASEIRPAQGGTWDRIKVHRILNTSGA